VGGEFDTRSIALRWVRVDCLHLRRTPPFDRRLATHRRSRL
jgi:hypothetical protein